MPSPKTRLLVGFIAYGVIVGLLSAWWWGISDNVFFPNIPGMLIGDLVYNLSIRYMGDPHSSQAHYTIPWIMRIPQVYVPVSVIFWGVMGLAIRAAFGRSRR